MLRRSRPSRSVDYLLAILSPVDVVQATQRYIASQSADALRTHAHRAIARMRSAERRELATAFGQAVPRTDNPLFDDAAPNETELLSLIDESGALHQRFALFLQHNPRALRTLDAEAVNEILRPLVVHARAAMEPGARDPENGDDLRKSLLTALPSMNVMRARRWSRKVNAAARTTSRRVVEAPRATAAALIGILRWLVHPFVVAGKSIVVAVVGLAAAIAKIPALVLATLRWIAQPFVTAGKAIAAGVGVLARAIARIPSLLLSGARLLALPFVLAAHVLYSVATAIARAIARIPSLLLSGARLLVLPFVLATHVLGSVVTAVARAAARVPALLVGAARASAQPFALAAQRLQTLLIGLGAATGRIVASTARATAATATGLGHEVAKACRAVGTFAVQMAASMARSIAQVPAVLKSIVRALSKPCLAAKRVLERGAAKLGFEIVTGLIFTYALMRSGWKWLHRQAISTGAALVETSRRVPPLAEAGARRSSAYAHVVAQRSARIPPRLRRGVRWLTPRLNAIAVLVSAALFMIAIMMVVATVLLARVLLRVAHMGARLLQRIPPLVGRAVAWGRPRVASVSSASVDAYARAQAAGTQRARRSSAYAHDVARRSARIPATLRGVLRWLKPRLTAILVLLSSALFMIATMVVVAIVLLARILLQAGRTCARVLQQIPPLVGRAVAWGRPRVATGSQHVHAQMPRAQNTLRIAGKRSLHVVKSGLIMAIAVAFVVVSQSARLCVWVTRRAIAARPWEHARAVPLFALGGGLITLLLFMIIPEQMANEVGVRNIGKATIHPHKLHIAQFHRAAPSIHAVAFIATPVPIVTVHHHHVVLASPTATPMHVMTIATLLNPKKFPVHHDVRIPHVGAVTVAHRPPTVAQGAEQQVYTYLMSLSRGDDRAALRTLGMSPTASRDVIPEAALVHSATDFRILNSHTTDAYDATVSVDIRAPQGDYLALYTLSNDGSGMRIVYHSVIPNSAKAPALLSTR